MSDINQVTKNLGIKLYDATDEPGLIAGYVTAMTILDEAASKAGIDQAARAMAAAADVKATTADGKAVAAADAASIADGKATTAATTAEAAATAAATADAKAVAADTKATQAIADAATADGKAVVADGKADVAATAAATADGKAVVADGKAEAAATAAATADAKAVAAQSRADAAYALAEAAGGMTPVALTGQDCMAIFQPPSDYTLSNELPSGGYKVVTNDGMFVSFILTLYRASSTGASWVILHAGSTSLYDLSAVSIVANQTSPSGYEAVRCMEITNTGNVQIKYTSGQTKSVLQLMVTGFIKENE